MPRRRLETPPGRRAGLPAMDGFATVRIVQLAELISRGAAKVFDARFGLKNTELRILVHLASRDALAVNELARRTRVDKAWISRSLRALERRRLVSRAAHPSDTRASLISLTAAGRALLAKVAPVAEARNRHLLSGLDEAEVRRLLDALAARAEDLLSNPDLSGPANDAKR